VWLETPCIALLPSTFWVRKSSRQSRSQLSILLISSLQLKAGGSEG
jgi:hypothetical protein